MNAAFSSSIATQENASSKPSGLPSTTSGSRFDSSRPQQRLLVVRQRQQRPVHVAEGQVVAEEVLFLLVLGGRHQQVAPVLRSWREKTRTNSPKLGSSNSRSSRSEMTKAMDPVRPRARFRAAWLTE